MEIIGVPIDNTVASCSTIVLFMQLFGGAAFVTLLPVWLSVCMINGIVKMVRSWVVKVKQGKGE